MKNSDHMLDPGRWQRWKRLLIESWPAYLTAVLYVLCFPRARLGVLGFVCFVPLLAEAMEKSGRRAMWLGFIAGLLANVLKLYWLVYTISHYSPIPFPVAVLILLLMCSFLGLFWAIHFRLVHWAVKENVMPLWIIFPIGWVFFDYTLTWILGGFPWEILGCAAFHIPLLDQGFDLVGEHGLGWVLAFGNVVFYEFWVWYKRNRPFPFFKSILFTMMILVGLTYGAVRTTQVEEAMKAGKPIKVGMLQGNVEQDMKWKPENRDMILDDYAKLAQYVADQGAELIILPETAIPRRQDRARPLHAEVSRYALETGKFVLTGVPSNKVREDRTDPRGEYRRLNSAVLISPEGKAMDWYDKNKLVPFGEFIPKKHWLNKLAGKRVKGTLDFESGGNYNLFYFPPAPFAVFICYEAVYPNIVRRLNNLGAKFLVTITNDAWFGNTSAPYQHWSQVAIRAIENRRYIVRAANTGISGIIDPLGHTVKSTPLYRQTAEVGTIYTMNIRTIYGQIGDLVAYIVVYLYLCVLSVLAVVAWRQRKKRERA